MRRNPLSLPSAWGLGSQVEKREADLGVRSLDLSRERAHVEEQQARRALLDDDTLAVVRPSTGRVLAHPAAMHHPQTPRRYAAQRWIPGQPHVALRVLDAHSLVAGCTHEAVEECLQYTCSARQVLLFWSRAGFGDASTA
jgi:hypothetical protein